MKTRSKAKNSNMLQKGRTKHLSGSSMKKQYVCMLLVCDLANFINKIMVVSPNQDGKQEVPAPIPQTIVYSANARKGGRSMVTSSKRKIAVGMPSTFVFQRRHFKAYRYARVPFCTSLCTPLSRIRNISYHT